MFPSIEIDSDFDNNPTFDLHDNPRNLDGPLLPNGLIRLSDCLDYLDMDPIQDFIAMRCKPLEQGDKRFKKIPPSNRYKNLKPLWLKAEIKHKHLGRGEQTNKDEGTKNLSTVIRGRGYNNDDCGHVLASSLGGKMLDVNLYPQDRFINRGLKGNYCIWRLIECCMLLWVRDIPEKYNPTVKFQMLLEYPTNLNDQYADRPTKFRYSVQFLLDDDDSSSDEDNNERISVDSLAIFNVATITLRWQIEEALSLKESIKAQVEHASARCKKVVDEFLVEISAIIEEIERNSPPVRPNSPPVGSNRRPFRALARDRRTSFWDFVPVVGSIKTIFEGVEDLVDGNVNAACTNLLIGGACLGLDIVTMGGAATVVKSAGKVLAKEMAKSAAKQVGKQVTVILIEQTGEAALKTVLSAAVSNELKAVRPR